MDAGYAKEQRFESLNKRTQLLFWILVAVMVLSIIVLVSDFALAELIKRAMRGEIVTESELIAIDNIQTAIWPWQIVLIIAYVVVFFMWIYKANKNLRSLRAAGLRFTPGWAVGWFFVPIMNLFRPYQIVSEIWKASDPGVDTTHDTSWKAVPTSPIVGCWFALYLISFFVARIAIQSIPSGIELSGLLNATYAYIVYDGLDIAFLLTTIFMVRGISQLQEAKNKLISSTY